MTTRTYVLSISVASYHLCVISTRASVVDVPARLYPQIAYYPWHHRQYNLLSSTYFIIIDSKTFAAIGVIDVGLMSVFTDISGLVYGSGIILADFHTVGRTPSCNEQLKILASGPPIQSARSFNVPMLSGPVDLLGQKPCHLHS